MIYVHLAGGFILLLVGGEALVRGSVGVARRLRVSPLVIGITLVGFGTSMPEMVTSIEAALSGSPGIALGNIVGSNIANILLILGTASVIAPVGCPRGVLHRDGTMVAVAAVACLVVALAGTVGRIAGGFFIAALIGYVLATYWQEHRRGTASAELHRAESEGVTPSPTNLLVALLLAAAGIGATILGAKWLVLGAIRLAIHLGVTDSVIGLSVVALGTSLPELAASVVAAMRRQPAIALGNVLGSNIYNVLGILGVTALVHPLYVPPTMLARDIWVLIGVTALLIVAAWSGSIISRREGIVFLVIYAGYIGWLFAAGR